MPPIEQATMTSSTRFARPLSHLDDDDRSSSPDPLATSMNDENTFPRASPIKLRSSPIKSTTPSPRKRRNTKILQDVTLSSPQKASARSVQSFGSPSRSQTEQFLSPWKIRVTVEAEPEELDCGRVRSRSKTTMIPLRDASSPSNTPEPRGRSRSGSRKSVKRGRATGTPPRQTRQKNRAEVGRLTDLDTNFLNSECEEKDAKPKRASRARKSKKAFEILEDGILADQHPISFTTLPEGVTELSQVQDINYEHDAETNSEEGTSPGRDSPKLRELDFNRISVRTRNVPPRAVQLAEHASDPEIGGSSLPLVRPMSSEVMDVGKQQDSEAKAITYPTPEASVQDEVEVQGPHSDPTDEHVGFDTILESEGFTMIDLESIPSARHFITSPDSTEHRQPEALANNGSPADLTQSTSVAYPILVPPSSLKERSSPSHLSKACKPPPTPIPSYLAPPEEGESDLSSTVPSSPPVDLVQENPPPRSASFVSSRLHQAHTPLEATESSPQLPSPPCQPPKIEKLLMKEDSRPTPPRLTRVVRAGIAFQGLLSPKARPPFLQPSPIPNITTMSKRNATPVGRLDDIFNGFDSGTRRELRAGLRFGEELAKRQRLSSPEASFLGKNGAAESHSQDQHKNEILPPKSNIPASYSPPTRQEPATPFDADKTVGSIMYLGTEARERRWQLEREAVSRQIETANTSQVIVIDSDIEDQTSELRREASTPHLSPAKSMTSEDDEDVWVAEAEKAQNSSRHTEEELFPRAEQLRQRERAREVITKPKRRFIPSPWKRGEDVDATFMTNGDSSGMFWQQPKSTATSSSLSRPISNGRKFDVKEMLGGSPVKDYQVSAAAKRDREPHDAEEHEKCMEEERSLSKIEAETLDFEDERENENFAESESDLEAEYQNDENTCQESSLPPQPVTIPVKFNDTTDVSADADDGDQDDSQLKSPPSTPRHPITPRSAMKGSRTSVNFTAEPASPTPRKVAFTPLTQLYDESGIETSMQVRGGRLSPEPSTTSSDKTKDEEDTNAPPQQAAPTSWFSKLTSWAIGSASSSDVNATAPSDQKPTRNDIQWEPTRTTIAATRNPRTSNTTAAAAVAKSPTAPSQSSTNPNRLDPRIPPPPTSLPISGYFSDNHYKHLHILYLKSLKSSFTRPASVRPSLKSWVGRKCYSGDGEFVWEITGRDVEVLERWFRGFEERGVKDSDAEGVRKGRYRVVEWRVEELVMRLFSVVVGMEVRREEREKEKK